MLQKLSSSKINREPKDVQIWLNFLCSDAGAIYYRGATLTIDGGWTAG